MRVFQERLDANGKWQSLGTPFEDARLVLFFGGRDLLDDPAVFQHLRERHPKAILMGCSTAGEICGTQVSDSTLIATAIHFEHTRLQLVSTTVNEAGHSRMAGRQLAESLERSGLAHVFVLSDGLHVNGTELVAGLSEGLPENVALTGGLSGDGANFGRTLVCADEAAAECRVAALGLYGDRLRVGFGSLGGWDPFGPERLITRSSGNVLYELDGESALALYKRYLGEHGSGLPATGLLFPLALRVAEHSTPVVRTILAVNEAEQSLTFAGDVPQGARVRLMKANFERLIDGATGAAKISQDLSGLSAQLAILISCVGRRLVLKQRVEEEVEGVRDVLGKNAVLAGFYSYGEISPHTPSAKCELHNQTMTITTFNEI
ncbi:MAG: FIST C-terminal domain-containing protein [Propionivibrio sp.]|uniref:FIST signal transduction protein n=1 Tax=Propionivibrio sp. TaxID=2212460 RepID=UPI0025DE984F|nr:FIST N-terminal domain-containing protein [Propionivibrio sp.]MBL0207608.1 FIST C-terminal domain-containing protein [Propionivibrio sp.]